MIITAGENISSVEIEIALAGHPAVLEYAVVAAPDARWGEVPVALVVLKPGCGRDRQGPSGVLPATDGPLKVPREIHFRDALPKGGTGKILKAELREPFWAGFDKPGPLTGLVARPDCRTGVRPVPYDAVVSDLSALAFGGSIAGIAGGLSLLVHGFAGYRRASRVADVATSRIASLAVGEVRVSGRVEPAELTLVSPLQSRTCVYYRAHVHQGEGRNRRTVLDDERAVGFRIRDESGAIRVFPRGASWDVPPRFRESGSLSGDEPVGLNPRDGPAIQAGVPDRAELVAKLLTVHHGLDRSGPGDMPADSAALFGDPLATMMPTARRDYEESRIELGETVTIVATALPFDQLARPRRLGRRGRRCGRRTNGRDRGPRDCRGSRGRAGRRDARVECRRGVGECRNPGIRHWASGSRAEA